MDLIITLEEISARSFDFQAASDQARCSRLSR